MVHGGEKVFNNNLQKEDNQYNNSINKKDFLKEVTKYVKIKKS